MKQNMMQKYAYTQESNTLIIKKTTHINGKSSWDYCTLDNFGLLSLLWWPSSHI